MPSRNMRKVSRSRSRSRLVLAAAAAAMILTSTVVVPMVLAPTSDATAVNVGVAEERRTTTTTTISVVSSSTTTAATTPATTTTNSDSSVTGAEEQAEDESQDYDNDKEDAVEASELESSSLYFPSMYTIHYGRDANTNNEEAEAEAEAEAEGSSTRTSHSSTNNTNTKCSTTTTNRNIKKWIQEYDYDLIHWDTENCLAHLLLHDEDEYTAMLATMNSTTTTTRHKNKQPHENGEELQLVPAQVHSNSSLTELWIKPKLQVAEDFQRQQQQEIARKKSRNLRSDGTAVSLSSSRYDDKSSNRNTSRKLYSTISNNNNGQYGCYLDYYGTMEWINDFVATYQNKNDLLEIEWLTIGKSHLKSQNSNTGQDIKVLTITAKDDPSTTTPTKKGPCIFLSGVHAREYATPETVRRWIKYAIVEKVLRDRDPDYISMLETTTLHWISYLNPDGRIAAETDAPYRRKNMNNVGPCQKNSKVKSGVDLNRYVERVFINNSSICIIHRYHVDSTCVTCYVLWCVLFAGVTSHNLPNIYFRMGPRTTEIFRSNGVNGMGVQQKCVIIPIVVQIRPQKQKQRR